MGRRIHILGHRGCPVLGRVVAALRRAGIPYHAHAYHNPRKVEYHRQRLGGTADAAVHTWRGSTTIGNAAHVVAYAEGLAKFAYPEHPASACHTKSTEHYNRCWRAATGLQGKKDCWQTARQTYRQCIA